MRKSALFWVLATFILGLVLYFLSPSCSNQLFGENGYFTSGNLQQLRSAMRISSGYVLTIMFAVLLITSVRISFVNRIMGGLDNLYYIHKWIGIVGMAIVMFHWWVVKFYGDYLKSINYPKMPKGAPLEGWQGVVFKIGHDWIEWAFYPMILIILVALITRITYKYFAYTHRLIPYIYLIVAMHVWGFGLRMDFGSSFSGWVLYIVTILGTIAALIDIFHKQGFWNRSWAKVISISRNDDNKTITLELETEKAIKYDAGQFAFLKIPSISVEPHPFSIAGYSDSNKQVLRFVIKEFGDYTEQIINKVKVDDRIRVEGGYGEFTFHEAGNQVWVAAGVGITPFIARLEYIKANPSARGEGKIDFFFSYKGEFEHKEYIETLCKESNINFNYINNADNNKLFTYEDIKAGSTDFKNSTVWFCGPKGFRQVIAIGLKNDKYKASKLHFDNFSMR